MTRNPPGHILVCFSLFLLLQQNMNLTDCQHWLCFVDLAGVHCAADPKLCCWHVHFSVALGSGLSKSRPWDCDVVA